MLHTSLPRHHNDSCLNLCVHWLFPTQELPDCHLGSIRFPRTLSKPFKIAHKYPHAFDSSQNIQYLVMDLSTHSASRRSAILDLYYVLPIDVNHSAWLEDPNLHSGTGPCEEARAQQLCLNSFSTQTSDAYSFKVCITLERVYFFFKSGIFISLEFECLSSSWISWVNLTVHCLLCHIGSSYAIFI